MIALAFVTNLRAIAIMTSLCGFPRTLRRFASGSRAGLSPAAASAARNSTCRRERRPPAIDLLSRVAPLSCGIGARPVMVASSPDVIRPNSRNSANNIAAATGPIPRTDRSRFVLAERVFTCPMAFLIRRSMSAIRVAAQPGDVVLFTRHALPGKGRVDHAGQALPAEVVDDVQNPETAPV